MSCVTLDLRLLLPSWLRTKKKNRKINEESLIYVDFTWQFQKDYRNEFNKVPMKTTGEAVYDDVPMEMDTQTLEGAAIFENIHSFLNSQVTRKEDSEDSHEVDFIKDNFRFSKKLKKESRSKIHSISSLAVTLEQRQQLFGDYIFQDDCLERRGGKKKRGRAVSLV